MSHDVLAPVLVEGVSKTYERSGLRVAALSDVTLRVPAGEFLVVRGRSGSGKTTLLELIAGMLEPSDGKVIVAGTEIGNLSVDERALFRRRNIGVIYQFFNLVPTLSVDHNIALPLLLDGARMKTVRGRVAELMDRLGIWDLAARDVDELSGGEMQRVAIARSLIIDPVLILADEPTGNLDSRTGSDVLSLFSEINRKGDTTIVMMTHDPEATGCADRVVVLGDGRVERDSADRSDF